jgi:hypothetical protein
MSEAPEKPDAERQPLLGQVEAVGSPQPRPLLSGTKGTEVEKAPAVRDVLSAQTTLNLSIYALLALYTLAYDQVNHSFNHLLTMSIDLSHSFCLSLCIIPHNPAMILTFLSLSALRVDLG